MYVFENPNPQGIFVGDCVIRALSIAMNRSWYEIYSDLCAKGLEMSDMPSSNRVWAEYLKEHGWRRHIVPDTCPSCYTIRDFCGEHFKGTYIVGTGSHAVAVIDGSYYDAWNSGSEAALYYFEKEK